MKREIIPITSEKQWLDLRKKDITSTMSSAIFNVSPYLTPFELYHSHVSKIEVPFQVNERMHKGSRMEQYAAQEVGLKLGMEVRPNNNYIRIPELKIGSSFDYEIKCPDRGWGNLEIKAVDYFQYKEKWTEDEAPIHIETQFNHEMLCADKYQWGMIVPFTGIYDFKIYERTRNLDFENDIKSGVAKYWKDVANQNEPDADYYRDGKVINLLYKNTNDNAADLTEDDEFEELLAHFKQVSGEFSRAEKLKEALKFQIHDQLTDIGAAFTKKYKVTAGWTKDAKDTVITADMVGKTVKGKRGYRQCLIKDLTEGK